jgi:hypothetical protein
MHTLITVLSLATATAHGPSAPDDKFPSHVFSTDAHAPERVQLGFNFGLTQPILMHGFNAAVDIRYKRLVLTYSHGAGLDYSSLESAQAKDAGAKLRLPWTTGGGVGLVLVDELWLLGDVKAHHFEVDSGVDHASYTTMTVGAEIGWRYFFWKGFNVALVARWWPNVYSSTGSVTLHDRTGAAFTDKPAQQGFGGFLGNVLVGWAFDL